MRQLDVALLTLGDPRQMTGGHLFQRRLAQRAAAHDARIRFLSLPPLPFPLPALAAPALLRRARGADVLVLDSIAAAFAAPWMAATGDRLPPLVGLLHQPPGGIGHAAPRARLQAPLDREAYRRARLLLLASASLADELRPLDVPLRLLSPGRDPAPAPSPGSAGDLRQGRRAAILCVANWLPNKGIAELVVAFATLPESLATLHLVGRVDVDADYAAALAARLARPDLRDRVVVHGEVAPERVAALYAGADLFALTSYRETYGTAWGEAMATGLPIVGWRSGNLPQLAAHEREALLVEPGAIGDLSVALQRLAEDGALRRCLGRNAAARATTRPTWDDTAAAFFDALREVSAAR